MAQPEPAAAFAAEAPHEPWSPEAIRTRLALVRDAFAERRVCLPKPMAPDEAEQLMALADDPDGDMVEKADQVGHPERWQIGRWR